jgi:hypothetical protein
VDLPQPPDQRAQARAKVLGQAGELGIHGTRCYAKLISFTLLYVPKLTGVSVSP